MKGWTIIHKIKALYDDGNGSSIRSISQELDISRNTVKKYLRMTEEEISKLQLNKSRRKELDKYREYITYLLDKDPDATSSKVMEKLFEKGFSPNVSQRTMRRYINLLLSNN